MRVGQVWQWIYQKGVRSFDVMTNLAKAYRATLAENFTIAVPEVVSRQVSDDGTRKYLVRIYDPRLYKAVAGRLAVMLGSRMHSAIFAAGCEEEGERQIS